MRNAITGVLLWLIGAGAAQAENRTTTGDLIVEPRTLIALGFE